MKMDIKDRIKLQTKIKIDEKQGCGNVNWSAIPKKEDQLHQYHKNPLPSFLMMEKDVYDHQSCNPNKKYNRAKKHKNNSGKEDDKFQISEIRQSIQEVGVGWDVLYALEVRYRESQKDYAMPGNRSGSNVSFTTARTTTTTISEDSFLSVEQDFEQLKISNEKVQDEVFCGSNGDKERYKRNALIKGIIRSKQENCLLGENKSMDLSIVKNWPDLVKDIKYGKENQKRDENKQENSLNIHKTQGMSVEHDSMEKNCPKLKNAETSRQYFMNIKDEDYKFVSKKSMRKTKKSLKAGRHEFKKFYY